MAEDSTVTFSLPEEAAPLVHPKARRVDVGRLLAYVFLMVGTAVALVPFLYTVSVSLMNLTEATGGASLPRVPNWENYPKAWNVADSRFIFGIQSRLPQSLVGQVVFCTLAAYAFAQ